MGSPCGNGGAAAFRAACGSPHSPGMGMGASGAAGAGLGAGFDSFYGFGSSSQLHSNCI